MRMGGRIAAGIEVLEDIFARHRPASEALKDWGKAHRFAGSGDRHAIGTLVFDVLRKRNSLGFAIGADRPRALALAAVVRGWKKTRVEVSAWAAEPHGFAALADDESRALAENRISPEPWIAGDYPEWLQTSFFRVFSETAAQEGAALAERAPIDLRANTLKTDRPALLAAFEKFGAVEGPLSPWSVRIPASGPDARSPNVEAEPAHGLGWFEVQDSASQVAAMLSGAAPGETVADICAGAGGKTLALAAMMQNQGKLTAFDTDKFRLRPIFERMARAGATNIEVIPADERARFDKLKGKLDCVFVDAPCSGSGAWRRKPDAKWRLTEALLKQRIRDQRQVLDQAAKLVRPGGRVVYVTCSVLQEENRDQIRWFQGDHPDFALAPLSLRGATSETVTMTPLRHGTDGFFVAVLRKALS
jgi:16S rRNA (cytosine967-C5)-methyltransferase